MAAVAVVEVVEVVAVFCAGVQVQDLTVSFPFRSMLGPYVDITAKLEFEAQELPPGPLGTTVRKLREEGVGIHFGRWLIDGAPLVVLLDVEASMERAEEWKRDFYEKTKIGAPWDDDESTHAVIFG